MTPIGPATQTTTGRPDPKLLALSQELESQFLAEMLKSASLGKARDAFGGGAGESQFSSFLVNEYASATAKAGGIGLAEVIYNALIKKQIDQ